MTAATPPPARYVVSPLEAGERLDVFLAAASGASRRQVRRWAAEGAVEVNGKVVRVQSRTVEMADVVDLRVPSGELPNPVRSLPEPVPIVHEDPWLLVVNKPAGLLSQPMDERQGGELALNEVLPMQIAARDGNRPELKLFHRLDRVTSGLVLFARRREATRKLARAWQHGRAERVYLAVVEGEPGFESRTVEAPIARVADGAWRFEVAPHGRPARTEVEVARPGEGAALVRCRLLTGRTHQVRVHLAHLGFPVLGDRLYGASEGRAPRPLLHAAELAVPHPRGGALLALEAPLPEEMAGYAG